MQEELNDDIVIGSDSSEKVELGRLVNEDVNNSADTSEKELLSKDIEDAITRKVISNVNVDRVSDIDNCTAYLIDMTNCRSTKAWIEATKNFITGSELGTVSEAIAKINEGRLKHNEAELRADAALYFKTTSGVSLVGYVDELQMYKLLRNYIAVGFDKQVKVYQSSGGKATFKEWRVTDCKGVRLVL